jgi:hypothetical protein
VIDLRAPQYLLAIGLDAHPIEQGGAEAVIIELFRIQPHVEAEIAPEQPEQALTGHSASACALASAGDGFLG